MIRKLNKKLIYICVMSSTVIAILLMVIPIFQNAKKEQANLEKAPAQAYVGADDAFMLSGTERFPKNYGALKNFEKENTVPQAKAPVEDLAEVLAKLGKIDEKKKKADIATTNFSEPDPWKEASMREQEQRAMDYYAARRSDIIFVRNKTSDRNNKSQQEKSNAMEKMLHRSLELAERHMGGAQNNYHDVFFKNPNNKKSDTIGKIQEPAPFMLSEGTLIPTVLVSEIDTSLPGPILARVSHNIWDSKTGQALLIPQNSTLIGKYNSQVTHGQSRAQVVWSRIIFPNQQSVNLGEMVGVDKRGVSGASGRVNNHYDKVALGLLLTTTLGAGVRVTQGKYDANSAALGQEMGNILAQETARLGNKITEKMLAIPPTIKVPMGKRLNVFVEQDLNLQPYQG